ncbi:hypothetical protein [Nitratireductor pacificus]|uniref:hypothetical protein n=1 Tax=Nitratireductor pacificus TaxID=1231180 RepID=UPI0012F64326|nr:hypothetical protein [Nitratireductor pacificus]
MNGVSPGTVFSLFYGFARGGSSAPQAASVRTRFVPSDHLRRCCAFRRRNPTSMPRLAMLDRPVPHLPAKAIYLGKLKMEAGFLKGNIVDFEWVSQSD